MDFQNEISWDQSTDEANEIAPLNDLEWELLIETDDQRAIRRHWFKQRENGLERFVGVHSHSTWSSTWNHHP
jgi:hypothetical protein